MFFLKLFLTAFINFFCSASQANFLVQTTPAPSSPEFIRIYISKFQSHYTCDTNTQLLFPFKVLKTSYFPANNSLLFNLQMQKIKFLRINVAINAKEYLK